MRRAVPIVITVLIAAIAILAVVLALPDGGRAAHTFGQQNAGAATSTRTESSTAAPHATVAVPALPRLTGTETATPTPAAHASPRNAETTTGASEPGPTGAVTGETPTPSMDARSTPAPITTTSARARLTAAASTSVSPAPVAKIPTTTAQSQPTTPKPAATTPKPAAPAFGIPVTLGNAAQLLTVTATSSTATVGTLRAWEKTAAGAWRVVYGPITANLGSAGIGPASEYYSRTPLGTFTLTEAFGALANPGTALPYHVTGPNDWWVSDVNAPSYNTMQTCAAAVCPFNTRLAEHLQTVTPYYDYAVVMDVNRSPVVKGGGSAFFLHVTVGRPTAGCVAIDRAALVQIMRWLNPAAHPRIATGIG